MLEDELYEPALDEVNPRLHLAVHGVVVNQILAEEPPETWAAVQRLSGLGYERHEVLHMVSSAVADQLWHVMSEKRPFDHEAYAATLDALPDSWEAERDEADIEDDYLDLDDESDPDDLDDLPRPPDGTIFTHRLSEAEVTGQVLVWASDLQPLDPLLADHGHLHLSDGQVAELEYEDDLGEVLAGPPGWLERFGPGDLLGLRVVDDEVQLEAVSDAPVTVVGLDVRLRAAFDGEGDGMPVPVPALVNAVLGELDAPLTGPLPPVGDLLEAGGLEVHDGHVAPAGTDWEAFGRAQTLAILVALYGLGLDQAQALVAALTVYRMFAEDGPERFEGDPSFANTFGQALAEPVIVAAFVDFALVAAAGGASVEELYRFAEWLAPRVRRRDRAGVTWIASVAARRQGDHERAETLLAEGIDIDPEHPLVIEDVAWYANDRGDVRRAVELLGRLGNPDADERASALAPFAVAPTTPLARRNDPCPCGSGRKFKFCCLHAQRQVPLPDRVSWIWTKLTWFCLRGGLEDEVDEVVEALESDVPEYELLAVSLVLFQDGAIDRFLAERGPVLPDDERNLVAQWALVDRSVHEVAEVTPGAGVVLRDIRTGDVVEVRERLGSTQLSVGDLLYAHVVPDGETHQMVGGVVSIPLRLRDQLVTLLDEGYDALDLAELLAAGVAAPEMHTTEGEPIVLGEAHFFVADPSAVVALDNVLEREAEGTWSESVEVEGRRWIRGIVVHEGDELVVSANSEARIARLRHIVETTVPGASLVSESSRTPAQVLAERPSPELAQAAPLPPGAAEALDAFVREQEDRWVDESVPALGGLTPRQAAADPTRREQLVALLHEFGRAAPPPGAATFDTGRLRARLRLDQS